jgi:hypothetical protein
MDFWLFMGRKNKDIKSTELQEYCSFFLDIFLKLKIATQTPAMQAFRTAYNNTGYYWLNTSPSACQAYCVYMVTGEILKSIKLTSIAPNKALCK